MYKNEDVERLIAEGKLVPAPAGSIPAFPPIPTYPAAPGPGFIAPLPTSWSQQPDQQRAFHNSAMPQVRITPLNPAASLTGGAAAASQATHVAATVVAPIIATVATHTTEINNLTAISFQGAYSAITSYSQGASVDSGGVIYISLQNNNLGNSPSSSPTFWQNTGGASVFEGTWNSATSYVDGNSVLHTNAGVTAFYVAIAPSTNKIPSSNPTFWQVTGSSSTYVFLGAYNPATTYFSGNQVTYNPSGGGSIYWICISQTTGNAPSQASSFWELVGTSAANLSGLDGVSPTPTALNLVYNGDFSIATVPTGIQSATASAIRVQDNSNGGGIQPSANGWTRNFEVAGVGSGEGVIY
jgi:hypothetical protein